MVTVGVGWGGRLRDPGRESRAGMGFAHRPRCVCVRASHSQARPPCSLRRPSSQVLPSVPDQGSHGALGCLQSSPHACRSLFPLASPGSSSSPLPTCSFFSIQNTKLLPPGCRPGTGEMSPLWLCSMSSPSLTQQEEQLQGCSSFSWEALGQSTFGAPIGRTLVEFKCQQALLRAGQCLMNTNAGHYSYQTWSARKHQLRCFKGYNMKAIWADCPENSGRSGSIRCVCESWSCSDSSFQRLVFFLTMDLLSSYLVVGKI